MTNVPARVPSRPVTMLEEEFGLALMEGEEVLVEGRPQAATLQRYLMLTIVLVMLVTIVGVVGLLAYPLVRLLVRAYVGKHRYWLTSSRIVVTTGIIGFRARSIPLERISDVAISCNWLEKMMGLRSVIVRDMTGEALSGATMLAYENPSQLQQQILDEVHSVNRVERKQNDEALAAGRPYRQIESGGDSEMLELLRRIEANTRVDESSSGS